MYQIPRNALALLLAGLSLVILPHISLLPVWITLLAAACCFWRVMVYQGRWSYPGKWTKVAFVLAGIAGVAFGYGTLLGLEPWIGMLVLAFVLKLLEMHKKRDAYTVIILAYFVALTVFLFDQTIPYTLYVYGCVTVITAALIALNQRSSATATGSLRRATAMLLQAIPLMLVLFVLFPRISPLWTIPLQSNIAKTGVSDTMSPGSIAELVQSDELAFRATFEREVPSYQDLYWRGLVLSYFDSENQSWNQERPGLYGRTWQLGQGETQWSENLEYMGKPVNYTVMMEPSNRNWMFSLTLPQVTDTPGFGMVRDFRFYSFREIRSRFRYELTSYLDFRTDLVLSDFWRYRYTLLPEKDNPRTKLLAAKIRAESDSDRDYLNRIMRRYALEGYAYTLKPPIVEGDTVDEFLFTSKRGFCEHFAGSFVYLMRAANIPARVVVGYQGGEYNQRGNYLAVYQFDAHAWTEVWLPEQGWVRVDPTSIVSPERITEGLESALEDEDTFLSDVGLSFMKFRSSLLLTELRLQFSAMNHYWDAWVVGYTPSVQMNFLSRYFGELDRKTLGMLLVGFFFAVFAVIGAGLLLRRTFDRRPPVEREYLKFCQLFARKELPRQKGEGPLDYAARLIASRPELAPAISAVTNAYVKANYIESDSSEIERLRKAVRNIRLKA